MKAQDFYQTLTNFGISFFTGVPDSLLKTFCDFIIATVPEKHLAAANEGTAVGLAIGHHLATGSIPAIYLQNSGLGNAINPLVSLAHNDVYQIPMLLIIGWRGEPNFEDEPQHQVQGAITLPLLQLLKIPFLTISKSTDQHEIHSFLLKKLGSTSGPAAIIVSKETFESRSSSIKQPLSINLSRHEALNILLKVFSESDIIVATTGKLARELISLRKDGDVHEGDFLCVGGMGHASSIATGIAISFPDRRVICLDGDGAMQMHMGAAATIGEIRPQNLLHFLFNNGTHESVGGQPVTAPNIDYQLLAKAFGYHNQIRVSDSQGLVSAIDHCEVNAGPVLIEICLSASEDELLPRPDKTPILSKQIFQKFIKSE